VTSPAANEMGEQKTILRVLRGNSLTPPPVWMMRQAGRYLSEYRETRRKAGSFLDLCYSPDMACEVTLQPIRRFGFDAAILFSDILVIPDALGQDVRFEEGTGPVLEPVDLSVPFERSDADVLEHLEPVLQAVSSIRAALSPQTTLLGFCGAPWTVATYMIAGRGTPDQAPARLAALRERDAFDRLIDRLVEVSIRYLVEQLRRGADAVQVFDTWAGILAPEDFERYSLEPMKRIVEGIRAKVPGAPVIGFPKGATAHLERYARETGINAIGIDWTVPLQRAKALQEICAVQGNLDPMRLIAGGDAMNRAIDEIVAVLSGGPFIFNLGHGVTPQTPVEHVAQMIARVRGTHRTG